MTSNIILTGFSGTGKSHIGYIVSQMMRWDFMDTDDELTKRASATIEEIFKNYGESKFRQMEKALISEFSDLSNFVISTGGGAIVDEENYKYMKENGFIVCLEAKADTINARIKQQHNVRPLISQGDPHERINQLKSQRQHQYAMSDWTVHTDHLTPIQVAREIIRAWEIRQDQIYEQVRLGTLSQVPSFTVSTKSLSYPVFVNYGILTKITEYLKFAGVSDQVFVISDEVLKDTHLATLKLSLINAGIDCKTFLVRSGEHNKSMETAQAIYSWLVENRAERSSTLLALGGGVIGDLTGFVAATFLRGLKVIQVPTSLAAMVDASIGGKTAVNLPEAKNLVGAFHQPIAVYADLDTLKTLSSRELASGWAEAIKHGLILDKDLFSLFETRYQDITYMSPEISEHIISRSMEIKARVIEQDERETTGRRILLNYGHTIGHGLEAASRYGTLLHGEAVSIGMMGAGIISNRMGLLSSGNLDRQRSVLKNFNLPLEYSSIDPEDILKAIQLDKKIASKKINWVLLEDIGKTCIRTDVPEDLVKEIVHSLCN
jgi:3-dehydroquinate synthase